MRLYLKILSIFLLIGLLPLLILAGYSFFQVEEAVRASRHQALLSLGAEVGKEVQRMVHEGYNSILLLAENPVLLQASSDREEIFEELAKTQRFHPIIKDLTLLGPDGDVRASVFHSFRGTWSATSWFQGAARGESILSEVHALIHPHQVIMTVAVPVRAKADGSILHILIGQIDMEPIWRIIRNVDFGDEGQTLLVDRRGYLVAGPDSMTLLDPVPFPDLHRTIREHSTGILRFHDGPRAMIAAFVPVDADQEYITTGWNTVLMQPQAAAYAAVFQVRHGLMVTALSALMAVLVLSALLSRWISRRLNTLVMAARHLGQENFQTIVDDTGKGELGELGQAFNRAGRELAASGQQIRRHREELERLVEERTAELVKAIKKLHLEMEERQRVDEARRKLEEQLRQSQKLEAVGTLAGGISHDFNNLLQIISGQVQLLLMRGTLNEATRGSLLQIDLAVGRASEMIRRLLTFSRKMETVRRRYDLNEGVANVMDLLRRTIPRMIALESRLASDLFLIRADPTQMEQVLVNLASNARDAMPTGGRLLIETENVVYLPISPRPILICRQARASC
jgi:signal transduction histidine kinase